MCFDWTAEAHNKKTNQGWQTRMIFNYRYIEQKSWEQIATLMHMGIATVFRKHKNQLKVNHEN